MVVVTTGLFPTEFDGTTDALCRTLDAFGVPDQVLHEDQEYVYNLMMSVGDASPTIPLDSTMEAMDLLFIGLIYHRHMPFEDAKTGEMITFGKDNSEYTKTLALLSLALHEQVGINPEQIMEVASEAARFIVGHLTPPKSDSPDDFDLHREVIALATVGLLVHRYLPRSEARPDRKKQ